MNLNLGSLSFNANIETGGGTPSWGTELGQGEGYRFSFEKMEELFTSLVYTSVADINQIYCPLGKGGNQQNDYEFVIAGHYTKVFVNGIPVQDGEFLLLVVKKIVGNNHVGRRTIKYNPRITYKGVEINQDCFNKMAKALGLSNNAAWFIDEINVANQDELHFTAYILNATGDCSFENSDERKKAYVNQIKNQKGIVKSQISDRIQLSKIRQQIFYGAPGTGKSYGVKKQLNGVNEENVVRITFHPDSDYSTFVGTYKPTMNKPKRATQVILDYENLVDKFKEYLAEQPVNITKACTLFGHDYHDSIIRVQENGHNISSLVSDAYKSGTTFDSQVRAGMSVYESNPMSDNGRGNIIYSFVPQAFIKAYIKAYETGDNVYLIIEEINRGNCAQIFGDLFQLLDRNDEGKSEYPVKADDDLRDYLETILGKDSLGIKNGELCLPSNLYIYATMNTSDQSLFPIDSAFKRRWDWKYIPISDAHEGWVIQVNGSKYDWWSFLNLINEKIWDATRSEDKKLGYFFCKADTNKCIKPDVFVGKVLFYIYNDIFKDYGLDDNIFIDKSNGKTLLFHSYFFPDGSVNEDKIQVLLENLEVFKYPNDVENAADNEDIESDAEQPTIDMVSDVVSLEDAESKENDNTKYNFDGKQSLGKGALAVSVVEKYMNEHPDFTFEELKEVFPDSMMGNTLKLIGFIVKDKDVAATHYSYKKKAYGYFKKERKYTDANNQPFFVSNYWNITNIQSIIDFAKSQGWDVTTE